MEAARIPWRPLGRILVEQGLLTSDELETALAQQERTGKRLGETIVECGFVSGPELSSALASQYGIELTTETGFGTGLRTQIQRRHEHERRGSRPRLVQSQRPEAIAEEPDTGEADEQAAEASLLTQLEEQWAKLAAAEALIDEHEQELAAVAAQRDRRRRQAVRFARAARTRVSSPEAQDDGLHEHSARLGDEIQARAEEIARLKEESAHAHDRRAALEQALAEREAELAHARAELAGAHETVTSAQAAIADQERRHHELGSEFERVVHARAEVEQSLASVQADRDERARKVDELQAELIQAHGALADAVTALADQNHRLDELAAELERVVHARAILEQEHADLQTRHDRRRRQAERLARRARARANTPEEHDERNRRLDELQAELAQTHGALANAVTAFAEQNHRLDELSVELERVVHARTALEQEHAHLETRHDRRRRQAERLARRARARVAGDAAGVEELDQLRAERDRAHERATWLEQALSERGGELAHVREELGSLGAAQSALEEREHALHALAQKLDRRRAQAVRLTKRLRSLRQVDEQQLSQIERLVADVRGCDAEIARLRHENERARERTKRFLERLRRERNRIEIHEPEPAPEIASHLVFVELPDRYLLVERAGPPPARDTPVELPELDRRLFVSGARRSPLPSDGRPCVVAQQRPGPPAE